MSLIFVTAFICDVNSNSGVYKQGCLVKRLKNLRVYAGPPTKFYHQCHIFLGNQFTGQHFVRINKISINLKIYSIKKVFLDSYAIAANR